MLRLLLATLLVSALHLPAAAQQNRKASAPAPFRWVNPLERSDIPGVRHATFESPSLKTEVGYCIYLPPGYDDATNVDKRYNVVYYLHGGRPGSETKSVGIARHVDRAIASGKIPPTIYVFVNGGPVSHYDMPDRPDAQGATVFVTELIPHVDATYRTRADRTGRALEGFSQGGRGTARIMFRHPELFCSAAPGGGGMATEKRISESDGVESESLRFAPGDNTWDLAREFARKPDPALRILVYVGDKDMNYEGNLEYMALLDELRIPYQRAIAADVPHSGEQVYQKIGDTVLTFHADNFRQAQSGSPTR